MHQIAAWLAQTPKSPKGILFASKNYNLLKFFSALIPFHFSLHGVVLLRLAQIKVRSRKLILPLANPAWTCTELLFLRKKNNEFIFFQGKKSKSLVWSNQEIQEQVCPWPMSRQYVANKSSTLRPQYWVKDIFQWFFSRVWSRPRMHWDTGRQPFEVQPATFPLCGSLLHCIYSCSVYTLALCNLHLPKLKLQL